MNGDKVKAMDEGAVTFLDVLGWKGIWEKHVDALERLDGLLKIIREGLEKLTITATDVDVSMRGSETRILSISDTIVILTPGPIVPTLRIHATLCQIALSESIIREIPLRGATSYGKFLRNENIMVGPAIDESASWHEATDWIGVIMTPSALFSLHGDIPEGWVNYNPPYKAKGFGNTCCVNWEYDQVRSGRCVRLAFYDMGPHTPEIAMKYSNTLKFLDRSAEQGG